MEFFREQQKKWRETNSYILRDTLYTEFIEEFENTLGGLEKHLLYHFLFSSPKVFSYHAKTQMVQWMEFIRNSEFVKININLSLNEENLNHHIIQLNLFVFKLTLFYFVSYCMEFSHYTFFLEKEIENVYTRINMMENILWKHFLYPLGDPKYIIDYRPTI
jgi:hypothetical protein